MSTDARAALGQLTDLVPFLRWRLGSPEHGELVGADLGADPDLLAAAITASRPAWDTDDDAVLASLWWQAYAYRVAGTAIACWLLTGVAPDPSGGGTAVGIARHRPSAVVYADTRAITDLEALAARLFDGHLDAVAVALRARHRVGTQLVWGNVAAALASAMLAVAGADGAPPTLRTRAEGVLAALPHDVGSLGRWCDGEYERTTCCLWYKAPTSRGAYCADCPLPRR